MLSNLQVGYKACNDNNDNTADAEIDGILYDPTCLALG